MDRVAVLVDAGYFFAAGSALVSGSGNQRRDSLIFDEKSAVKELEALAQRVAQNSPLLRIYWYDGASRKTGPTAEHSRLAHCNNIKVPLSKSNFNPFMVITQGNKKPLVKVRQGLRRYDGAV